jgi:hypothetical protein
VTSKSIWRAVFGAPSLGLVGAGGVVVVEMATVLDAPWKVTKPMPTPFASVPVGRPCSKSWITCSSGPTSSTAIVRPKPPVLGRTKAQPHIWVRVRPSLGAPGGWKPVPRWNAEKGMRR